MIRKALMSLTAVVLLVAVSAGVVSALDTNQGTTQKTNLINVRAYAPAAGAVGAPAAKPAEAEEIFKYIAK